MKTHAPIKQEKFNQPIGVFHENVSNEICEGEDYGASLGTAQKIMKNQDRDFELNGLVNGTFLGTISEEQIHNSPKMAIMLKFQPIKKSKD